MGISIDYISVGKVDESTKANIVNKVNELVNERSWEQCEPPHLLPVRGYEGRLFFTSKIALTFENAAAENEEGRAGDIEAVLELFINLSAENDIEWEVVIYDEHAGVISKGGCSDETRNQVLSLANMFELGEIFGGDYGDSIEVEEE